jgi:cation-transporting ATPase E
VRAAAVVVAIVPQGLALMIVVTYAAAALRLIGKGALVQQANAIESLGHVEVRCLDKTGTLTTNRVVFAEAHPFKVSGDEFGRLLGDAIASASDRNRTAEAIAAAFPGQIRHIVDEVHFTSALKWSAVAIDGAAGQGVFVIGAPDILAPALQAGTDLGPTVATWTAQGKRVLLFAHRPICHRLHDDSGEARLPKDLIPLGLLAFVDELRPEARETLRRFAELGIRLKLISGDDPRTVAALAAQAGFPEAIHLVSGTELEEMNDAEFAMAAREATIFGRTTPQQKERLIRSLRDQGRYVAMIGDGVNDILAIKRANLAVAVRSGSPATRGVAALVLLDDSFAALPPAFAEGQHVLGGMHDVVGLFLTRSIAVTAVILGAILAGAPFPITPKHNSVLALFAVGVPTLALAAGAQPVSPRGRLFRAIAPFLVPATLTIAPVDLTVYLLWWRVTDDVEIARTVLTTTLIGCGFLLILFVQPPAHFWVGGDTYSGDRRPAAMAAGLLVCYLGVLVVRPLRETFELSRMSGLDLLAIASVLAAWTLLVRWVWRGRWFERLFDLDGG